MDREMAANAATVGFSYVSLTSPRHVIEYSDFRDNLHLDEGGYRKMLNAILRSWDCWRDQLRRAALVSADSHAVCVDVGLPGSWLSPSSPSSPSRSFMDSSSFAAAYAVMAGNGRTSRDLSSAGMVEQRCEDALPKYRASPCVAAPGSSAAMATTAAAQSQGEKAMASIAAVHWCTDAAASKTRDSSCSSTDVTINKLCAKRVGAHINRLVSTASDGFSPMALNTGGVHRLSRTAMASPPPSTLAAAVGVAAQSSERLEAAVQAAVDKIQRVLLLAEHATAEAGVTTDHTCLEALDEIVRHHHERSCMFALAMAQHDFCEAHDRAARAVLIAQEQAIKASDAERLAEQATTIVSALGSDGSSTTTTARQTAQVVYQLAVQARNEAHATDAVAMAAQTEEAQMLKVLDTLLLARLRC